jgi:fatty acyl-CoA reductase
VNTYKDKFRIAITRPSIVSSSVSEPFPGWIEGVNGPTGLMLALGKGVFRSFYCDPTSNVEAIPCDMAANAMIAVAWKRANIQNNEMYICNLSTAGNIS